MAPENLDTFKYYMSISDASMRPEPNGSGKPTSPAGDTAAPVCFNEAGAEWLRKTGRYQILGWVFDH